MRGTSCPEAWEGRNAWRALPRRVGVGHENGDNGDGEEEEQHGERRMSRMNI